MDKEQAKNILRKVVNSDVKEAIETLIPELNESEDERNWRAVLDCVKDDALKEWLKKQKEQKHSLKLDIDVAFDAREPRDNWEYIKEFCDKFGRMPKDMDELDELVSYVMVKKQKEQKPAEWSEKDEKIRQSIIKDIEWERNYTYATTGKVIGKYSKQINWLKFLPERFNLQPKQEWGEEDEEMFEAFLHKLEVCDLLSNKEITWAKHRLKSIHPQPEHELDEENEKLWVHDDDIFLDAAKMIVEDSPRKSYGGVNKKSIVPWFYSLKERLMHIF